MFSLVANDEAGPVPGSACGPSLEAPRIRQPGPRSWPTRAGGTAIGAEVPGLTNGRFRRGWPGAHECVRRQVRDSRSEFRSRTGRRAAPLEASLQCLPNPYAD